MKSLHGQICQAKWHFKFTMVTSIELLMIPME